MIPTAIKYIYMKYGGKPLPPSYVYIRYTLISHSLLSSTEQLFQNQHFDLNFYWNVYRLQSFKTVYETCMWNKKYRDFKCL